LAATVNKNKTIIAVVSSAQTPRICLFILSQMVHKTTKTKMFFTQVLQLSAALILLLNSIQSVDALIDQPSIDYLIDDVIYDPLPSMDEIIISVKAGENLTLQCRIKRVCLSDYATECTDPGTTRWFTPNTLPPRDNSVRKQMQFDHRVRSTNATEKSTVFDIVMTLKLINIGFIHAGRYECTSIQDQTSFKIVVLGKSCNLKCLNSTNLKLK